MMNVELNEILVNEQSNRNRSFISLIGLMLVISLFLIQMHGTNIRNDQFASDYLNGEIAVPASLS